MNGADLFLGEKEEMLLGRYVDGVCTRFEGRRAKKLLSKSREARLFVELLSESQDLLLDYVEQEADAPTADMWQRVNRRIVEEERNALFLGKRVIEGVANSEDESKQRNFLQGWAGRMTWGFSGAAATVALGVFILDMPIDEFSGRYSVAKRKVSDVVAKVGVGFDSLRSNQIGLNQRTPVSAVQGSNGITVPVAFSSNTPRNDNTDFNAGRGNSIAEMGAPVSVTSGLGSVTAREAKERRLVEIDWLRSDGTLQLIPGSDVSSTLIWVKRDRSETAAQIAALDDVASKEKEITSFGVKSTPRQFAPLVVPVANEISR